MNVIEMADKIAEKHGMEKKQAKTLVQAVFDHMVETAKSGEEVSIAGSASSRWLRAKPGRDGTRQRERHPDCGFEEAGFFTGQTGQGRVECARARAGCEGKAKAKK